MHTVTGRGDRGHPEKSKKAVISLILGILSLVFSILSIIGIILGVIGLIYGGLGLSEVKRTKQQGRGIAIAGVICSLIGIALPIMLIIFYFSLTLMVN